MTSGARVLAQGEAPRAPIAFKKLHTKRTFEEVVAQVREMLFGGALKPGDRLPGERDLSVQLGIGRSALREALRALEASGLIILRKGKRGGAFISSGTPRVISENISDLLRLSSISVDQLFEVRLWIQTGLARAACQRATEEDIDRLRQNVHEGERLHARGLDLQRIEVNIESQYPRGIHSESGRSDRHSGIDRRAEGADPAGRILSHPQPLRRSPQVG